MMTLAVAAIALAQVQDLSTFRGVWATPSGSPVLVLNGAKTGQVCVKERHYTVFGLKRVPDGTFLGSYTAGNKFRNLDVGVGNVSSDFRAGNGNNSIYPNGWNKTLPQVGDSKRDIDNGSARIKLGDPNGSGIVTTFYLSMEDASQRDVLTSQLFVYVGKVGQISFDGDFVSGPIELKLRDSGGVSSSLSGEGIYNGAKYLLVGSRSAGRGSFALVSPSTGKKVGHGFIEWYPTSRAVTGARDGLIHTDQLIVQMTSPETRETRRTFVRR